MLAEDDSGLNYVDVMQLRPVSVGERAGQEVGLLLVVAFEAHAVARPDDGLHQLRGVVG